MEKIQKIGVSAFIYKDGKILILKRSKKEKFMPGFWDLPGGKVSFGESPEDAIVRETKEETNLDVEALKPYSLFSYLSDNGIRQTIDIQYITEVIEDPGDIKLSDAHEDFQWVSRNELDKYFEISDKLKKVIIKGFEEIKKK
jgi:8-oxo-dGTP diphosphatase